MANWYSKERIIIEREEDVEGRSYNNYWKFDDKL